MKKMLFDACVAGDAATVRAALAAGEAVDTMADGWTPLHVAVEAGAAEVVRLLLEAGADPNLRNASGYTPIQIMMICEVHTPQLARLLIDAGADAGSPLHRAILVGEELTPDLLRFASAVDYAGNNALHTAIGVRRPDLIELLASSGTPVDGVDEDLTTPLMEAAAMGENAAIDALIRLRASLEMQDVNGRTALIFAAGNAHEASARLLLDAGANVNAQDRFGNTALHYAYENEEFDIARLLLDAGTDATLLNGDGLRAEAMVP
jgi:hypothetical protein